ncbi:MAG: hypothetical protein VYA80_04070 [Pseudomonadota bacterium]|nr:hypothetical protein [Pseudomonadota bacterium]
MRTSKHLMPINTEHLLPVLLVILFCMGCQPQAKERSAVIAGTTFPGTEGELQWLSFRDNLNNFSQDSLPLRLLIYGQLG